ncbi:hypothetical protein DM82_2402 [Burkholderia oklahomensis]|uniref:Uncharacterized protein n=1 Tax=Burkholderia oklahomensis TaxID=342113 RepID=A0AAI8B3A9_9BURK|nr:hypothetical protein DM82_2402 [Burkholderia oklahomensis]
MRVARSGGVGASVGHARERRVCCGNGGVRCARRSRVALPYAKAAASVRFMRAAPRRAAPRRRSRAACVKSWALVAYWRASSRAVRRAPLECGASKSAVPGRARHARSGIEGLRMQARRAGGGRIHLARNWLSCASSNSMDGDRCVACCALFARPPARRSFAARTHGEPDVGAGVMRIRRAPRARAVRATPTTTSARAPPSRARRPPTAASRAARPRGSRCRPARRRARCRD